MNEYANIHKQIINSTPVEKIIELTFIEYVSGDYENKKDEFIIVGNDGWIVESIFQHNNKKIEVVFQDDEDFWTVFVDKYDVCLKAYPYDSEFMKKILLKAITGMKNGNVLETMCLLEDNYFIRWDVSEE